MLPSISDEVVFNMTLVGSFGQKTLTKIIVILIYLPGYVSTEP